ncbi:MAG: FAD-binding oxidoreductase [Pseudomonadota bacterium]
MREERIERLSSPPPAPAGALFAGDFRPSPYWLDGLPPVPPLDDAPPASAEVVVVGAGYTGLNAALQTARAGRATVVLDAVAPGAGCSARNGGHVSTSIKPSLDALTRRFGAGRARAIRAEGPAALDWLERFVGEEGIDCAFRRSGRFHAAHSPAHYDRLARRAEEGMRREGIEAHAVPAGGQQAEIGSDFYAGGVVFPRFATVQPARYHRGLLDRVLAAGASVVAPCAATAIRRDGDGFEVATAAGRIRTRDVVVATNGYTGALLPWLRRRVIPITSTIIATEALPPGTVDALFPTGRIACDTRRVVYYYGPSPDRRRVVFGGRVSARDTDIATGAPRLHAEMARIFPALAGARISHAWSGRVAYTFDELAHTGVHEGIHYAMGYCGAGVSMSGYLGHRLGQRLLGRREGRTAFDDLPFPTRPLYSGTPWFLPAAVAWYRWRDDRECRAAARARSARERGMSVA